MAAERHARVMGRGWHSQDTGLFCHLLRAVGNLSRALERGELVDQLNALEELAGFTLAWLDNAPQEPSRMLDRLEDNLVPLAALLGMVAEAGLDPGKLELAAEAWLAMNRSVVFLMGAPPLDLPTIGQDMRDALLDLEQRYPDTPAFRVKPPKVLAAERLKQAERDVADGDPFSDERDVERAREALLGLDAITGLARTARDIMVMVRGNRGEHPTPTIMLPAGFLVEVLSVTDGMVDRLRFPDPGFRNGVPCVVYHQDLDGRAFIPACEEPDPWGAGGKDKEADGC